MTDGILISFKTYNCLPLSCREAIAKIIGLSGNFDHVTETIEGAESKDLAGLTLSDVRRFVARVNQKTMVVLKAIAEHGPDFKLAHIMEPAGFSTNPDEDGYRLFTGIRTGLTKRTRTILEDRKAELIRYRDNFDDTGYRDTDCSVSITTHQSLVDYFRN